jgi:hypothetical protein
MDRTLNEVQRCVNFYPEKTPEGYALISFPGLSLLGTTGNNAACRGTIQLIYEGSVMVYSVHGATVYRIYADGTATSVGTLSTSSGRVSMAASLTQVLIVDATDGYCLTISAGTTAVVADSNIGAAPSSCVFMDGYFIVNDSGTHTWRLSQLNDATDWTPVAFASAESLNDPIVSIQTDSKHLYLIGFNSIEIWYNTGNPSFPFERISGSGDGFGTVNGDTVANLNGRIFFVGSSSNGKGCVYLMEAGSRPVKVSVPPIEAIIDRWIYGAVLSFGFSWDGHEFYQVTNTSSGRSFAFDVTTGAWFERTSSGLGYNRCAMIINAHRFTGEGPFAFDTENGRIYQLKRDENDENGTDITRIKDWTVGDGTRYLFHDRIEIIAEMDHDSSASYTASGTLSWSDDGGLSFNTPITLSVSVTSGTTGQMIQFTNNRMGSSRKRIYRWTMAGPSARIVLKTCDLKYRVGSN